MGAPVLADAAGARLADVVQQRRNPQDAAGGSNAREQIAAEHRMERRVQGGDLAARAVGDQAVEVFQRVKLVVEDVAAMDGALIGAAAGVKFGEERAEQGEMLHAADGIGGGISIEDADEFGPDAFTGNAGQIARSGSDGGLRPLSEPQAVGGLEADAAQGTDGLVADGRIGDEFEPASAQVGRAAAMVDQRVADPASREVRERDCERVDGEVPPREVRVEPVGQVHDVERAVGQRQPESRNGPAEVNRAGIEEAASAGGPSGRIDGGDVDIGRGRAEQHVADRAADDVGLAESRQRREGSANRRRHRRPAPARPSSRGRRETGHGRCRRCR